MLADGGKPAQPAQPNGEGARRLDLLSDRRGRRLLFAVLYFAEGAPIGFVWWTLPVILRRHGLPAAEIGALTGLLVLPWALKFLWAPAIDVLRGPRFGLRGWIACSQVAMVATLLPLLWMDVTAAGGALTALLLAHAVAAATQDVAIDALAIRSAPEHEHGSLNGWMQVGMLVGRGLFGGAVLAAREPLGDEAVVALLALAIAATLPIHALYRSPETREGAPGRRGAERWRAFASVLRSVAERPGTWVLLLFAATSGAAFEVVGALAGPLLVDLGVADEAISRFFALPAVLGLGVGALAGGALSDRVGRGRTIAVASAGVAAGALMLAASARTGGDATPLVWTALSATYLFAGVFVASTYALFMDATDPRLGSTQFSATMGATNLCEAWSARVGGRVATGQGYPAAFVVGAVVTLLALPLLAVRRRAPPPE